MRAAGVPWLGLVTALWASNLSVRQIAFNMSQISFSGYTITKLSLNKDCLETRARQGSAARKVIALPVVCGLHQRYEYVPPDIRFGGTDAPVPT